MTVADSGRSALQALPVQIYRAGLGRRLPGAYVRIGAFFALPQVLERIGVDMEPLLAQTGVPRHLFDDPDNAIPFPVGARLILLATQASGRDDLGLLVGEGSNPSSLGLVGFLLQQAPDLRTALADLVRYLHHHDRGSVPFMSISGGMVALGYSILEPNVPAAAQIYDIAIAVGRNVLRGLCGPAWAPCEVTLARRRPAAPGRYERFFGAPVRFDAEQSALLFPERWLDTPIPSADAALRRVLQEQIDLLEAEETGMANQVRRLLRTALLTHSGSIDELAGLLGLRRRTLSRRLETEGTSFRQLCDEIQFEIARQLLEHTQMTITEIGLSLKYSETSAFSRAFKQWSGVSPRDWRSRRPEDLPA